MRGSAAWTDGGGPAGCHFEESEEGDALPVYSIAFKLYENGVTRDLTMDYGDFVLQGELAQLEMYDPEPCVEQ